MTANANTANTASQQQSESEKLRHHQQQQLKEVKRLYENMMLRIRLQHQLPGDQWAAATNMLTSFLAMVLAESCGGNALGAQAASFEVLTQVANKLQLTIAAMGQRAQ